MRNNFSAGTESLKTALQMFSKLECEGMPYQILSFDYLKTATVSIQWLIKNIQDFKIVFSQSVLFFELLSCSIALN